MSKIILKGYIEVSDEDLDVVMQELPNHIELTRAEAGCLVFNVTQDGENKNRFDVYEEFSDQEAFDQHQVRAGASYWAQVTANVARQYEITTVD